MNLPRSILASLLVIATVALSGCYNGEQIVERARNAAIRGRLEEVPLGYFRTTLPSNATELWRMEMEIELFLTAKRYRVDALQKALDGCEHRMRQDLLIAIRQTTAEEIADPKLTALRERLLNVTRAHVDKPPFHSLGIRQVRFIPL